VKNINPKSTFVKDIEYRDSLLLIPPYKSINEILFTLELTSPNTTGKKLEIMENKPNSLEDF
jgi:hypothetical protein